MVKERITGKRTWFKNAHFGMFAHFGLYSLIGGNENAVRKGSRATYRRWMKKFDPHKFDADLWVRQAKAGGCRYIVPTAKHAEGFCLWKTAASKHNVANTPFNRDIIAELSRACKKGGIKLGVYYNCNAWLDDHLDEKTFPEYFLTQIHELMTGYGEIAVVWFDHADPLLPLPVLKKAIRMIHDLQPTAVVDNRGYCTRRDHEGRRLFGDYITPERFVPQSFYGNHPFFEVCDAMGRRSWGYHRDESFWSVPELCRRLSDAVAKGGNYLLNVEPAPDGRIRPECVERLEAIGRWLKPHEEAIFDTDACPLKPVDDGRTWKPEIGVATRKNRSVYLHLHQWPSCDTVTVPYLGGQPAKATLLGSRNILRAERDEAGLKIRDLPPESPAAGPAIMRLDFRSAPEIDTRAISRDARTILEPVHGETIRLKAEQAELRANFGAPWQQVNCFPGGLTSIGHLYDYDAICIWRVKLDRAQTCRVSAIIGSLDIQSEAVFSLETGEQKIKGKTHRTGHWAIPERMKPFGTLRLKKGLNTITMRLLDMPNGCMADLYELILQPVTESRAK